MLTHIVIGIAVLMGLLIIGFLNYKHSLKIANEWFVFLKKVTAQGVLFKRSCGDGLKVRGHTSCRGMSPCNVTGAQRRSAGKTMEERTPASRRNRSYLSLSSY